MIEEFPGPDRGAVPLAMTPLLGLFELQKDIVRMHMEAASEVSRQSMRLFEPPAPSPLPEAPMQVMSFFGDCMRLSMSPLVLMTAGVMPRPLPPPTED
ncbi:MAG: hypothetical protein KDG55_12000 [Rhodocyclaceae bacterium]|nr:hypothetical protein [Rhodocyclaceae bacterium]